MLFSSRQMTPHLLLQIVVYLKDNFEIVLAVNLLFPITLTF